MLLRRNKGSGAPRMLRLGYTREGGSVHQPPAVFEGVHGSDTTITTGMTGCGKSMATRLKIAQIPMIPDKQGRHRRVWVIDGKGRDHYKGWFPNRHPVNLPPGMKPRGIKGFYFYYPVKAARARACMRCSVAAFDEKIRTCAKCGGHRSYEIVVHPNFGKYSYRQLEAMGFSGAAPRNLRDLVDKYGPFRSLEALKDFIEKYPTSEQESKLAAKKGRSASLHSKPYREGDYWRSDSKNALARDFRVNVLEKGVWSMDNTKDINVERLFLSGKNAVFSFNDRVLAKAETDYLFKKLLELTDKYPDVIAPHIVVEEAHEVFDDETLVDFVRTARKQGIPLDITLPTLAPFEKAETSDIASDAKQWIVGKLKGMNYSRAWKFIGHPAAGMIPSLQLDRHSGVREFLYFNGDKDQAYGPFQMYECPQEYVRRV